MSHAVRDNRDPALIGARLLGRKAGTKLSAVADTIDLTVADYRDTVTPNVPMCGLPPEGRRALVNGKCGPRIDPSGLRPE